MGISGLKTYLTHSESATETKLFVEKESIPYGSHLNIDANGWIFHIMESDGGKEILRQYGGSYSQLDSLIRTAYTDLMSLGFTVKFYFDGRGSRMKEETKRGRDDKRAESWLAIHDSVSEELNLNQLTLDLPTLSMQQFFYALSSLGASIVTTEFEADQGIAIACRDGNNSSDGRSHYCYGNDTDFLLMAGCPYIVFGMIASAKGPKKLRNGKFETLISAPVWRREVLSRNLRMTEEQLVEWCILIGNDYSKPFHSEPESLYDHPEIKELTEDFKQSLHRTIALKEFILSQELGFQVSSANVSLEKALQYSRKVYNLLDVAEYDNPVVRDVSGKAEAEGKSKKEGEGEDESEKESEKDEEYDTYDLSDDEKNLIRTWKLQRHPKGAISSEVGRHVIKFLRGDITNPRNELFRGITETQILAFEIMLKNIRQSMDDLSAKKMKAIKDKMSGLPVQNIPQNSPQNVPQKQGKGVECSLSYLQFEWTNACAARTFQLLCRELESTDKKQFNPMYMYDGHMFHTAMKNATTLSSKGDASLTLSVSVSVSQLDPIDDLTEQFESQDFYGVLTTAVEKKKRALLGVPRLLGTLGAAAAAKKDKKDIDDVLEAQKPLPIDKFTNAIIAAVYKERVVIIHGETGCGKSSRMPAILLDDAESRNENCRMMVAQPRRIAASALMKRMRVTLGKKVGLRMGHGVRDDYHETRITLVTTGYLAKLAAHQPEYFHNHTHLIIDEVHERAVDGDLMCLLAKKLLDRHPYMKLILMSATLQTHLYQDYFAPYSSTDKGVAQLSVGERRFPITVKYLEDLPGVLRVLADRVAEKDQQIRKGPLSDVPKGYSKEQFSLVKSLVCGGKWQNGQAILIFVSGISDIENLFKIFENKVTFKLFGIHTDIPFEEQEKAFDPCPTHVKLIIATNAAVSSVTFPDVDTVICLGTNKALRYDGKNHHVVLRNTWVSHATATQRAGRTGRVRPGVVYRLYSKKLYDKFDEHDEAEILRQPLQNVILALMTTMEDTEGFSNVRETLGELVEPPTDDNVNNSLHHLFVAGLIDKHQEEEQSTLTRLGRFVGHFPLDAQLGLLITYGIMLGVGAESVVFAAYLSMNQHVFRKASFLHKDPEEFCSIVRDSYLGAMQLDDGTYSEPVMHLNLYKKWISMNEAEQFKWAFLANISHSRMQGFVSNVKNLLQAVDKACKNTGKQSYSASKALNIETVITPQILNMYRLILTWMSYGNVMKQNPIKSIKKGPQLDSLHSLQLSGGKAGNKKSDKKVDVHITHELMDSLLPLYEELPMRKHLKKGKKKAQELVIIPWEMSTQGMKDYDAELSQCRAEAPREALLLDLLMCVATGKRVGYSGRHVEPIAWVFEESVTRIRDKDTTDSTDSEDPSDPSLDPYNTSENPFETPENPPDPSENTVESTVTSPLFLIVIPASFTQQIMGLQKFLNDTAPRHVFSLVLDPESAAIEYTLFESSTVSKSDVYNIRQYFQPFIFASMNIPVSGNSTLYVSNFRPTHEGLSDVFFTDDADESELSRYVGESAGVETINFPFLSSGIVTCGTSAASAGGAAASNQSTGGGFGGGVDNSMDAALIDPSIERVCDPYLMVLSDVPLGMRLMNSYRKAQKDSIINAPGGPITVAGPVPAWTTIELHKHISKVTNNSSCNPAVLPKHSVIDVAQHTGPETLYAVAYLSAKAKTETGGIVELMSGVTILPPGWLWITLALACAGVNTDGVTVNENQKNELKENKGSKGKKVESEEELAVIKQEEHALQMKNNDRADLCSDVMGYINDPNRHGVVKYNQALVDCIDLLFDEWINKKQ